MHPTLSGKPANLVMLFRQFRFIGTVLCVFAVLVACATTQPADEALVREAPAETDPEQEGVDPEVLFHFLAAERLGAAEQGEEALQEYLEEAQLSDDPEISEEITRLAVSVGAWDVAAIGAERWRELAPDDLMPRMFLIRSRLELEDSGAATRELLGLLDAEEDQSLAWQQVAALLAQAPEDALALEIMDRLVEKTASADRPDAMWGQSVLAWRLDDLARAIELGEAAALLSNDVDQLVWTAQLAVGDAQYERALELYRRARESEPDNAEIQLAIAETLRSLERFDEAHALLENMPADSNVLYTRGFYLVEDERLDEAAGVWRRMAALDEADRETHAFYTALLARLLDQHADALEWFEKVEDGPMRVRAVMQRALLLAEADDLARAKELLQAVRAEENGGVVEQSWLIEGQILRDAGRNDDALVILSDALAALPSSVPLLYSRALVAVEMDDLELAEQDFRHILQVEPDSPLALNALGYTLTDRTDRHREAYRLITRALEQAPDDPAILDSMGWVYFNLGRPEQALGYLRQALEGGYNPEIAAHLAEVLWELGERDEAVAVLDEAYDRYPEDEYLLDTRTRLGLARERGTGNGER